MKCLTVGIIAFAMTCCFAMDARIIEGAKLHEEAVENLDKIENSILVANESVEHWVKELHKGQNNFFATEYDREFDQNKIDEKKRNISDLSVQYNIAQETIKKYEPIKKEYNKQLEIESKRAKLKTGILNVTGMLILPLAVFALVGWGIVCQHRKYRRLLRDGKMTQEEYDRMMKNNSPFSTTRTNPATGLTMVGGCDSGGNPAGCSFRSNSTFSDTQDYSDRHRWNR
jgi:hypothetical protein